VRDTSYVRKAMAWKKAYSNYAFYRPQHAEAVGWRHETTTAVPYSPRTIDPAWLGWGGGVIIDHPNRRVIDVRPDVRGEPKLIVELSGDEKDVVIQCRCGDRISLVKLLGIEAVKPIFDGISGRIRGLIENMKPEQPA